MHLFDQKRPQINSCPAYFCYSTTQIHTLIPAGIINWPIVQLCEFKIYKLHFYLRCNEDLYSSVQRTMEVRKEELVLVLHTFEADPELFIQTVFHYTFFPVGYWKDKNKHAGNPVGSKRVSNKVLSQLSLEDV